MKFIRTITSGNIFGGGNLDQKQTSSLAFIWHSESPKKSFKCLIWMHEDTRWTLGPFSWLHLLRYECPTLVHCLRYFACMKLQEYCSCLAASPVFVLHPSLFRCELAALLGWTCTVLQKHASFTVMWLESQMYLGIYTDTLSLNTSSLTHTHRQVNQTERVD